MLRLFNMLQKRSKTNTIKKVRLQNLFNIIYICIYLVLLYIFSYANIFLTNKFGKKLKLYIKIIIPQKKNNIKKIV